MTKNYLQLKNEIKSIKETIDSLVYGSVEFREKDNKKYIYVHYRETGILKTKYVGEYSDELYNLIINNNQRVKELKSRLKKLLHELDEIKLTETEITDRVSLNIDLARRNLVDSIYKQSVLEGIATTHVNTETLVNGGKVKNMSVIDVQKTINLKHGWEFILDDGVITYPSNYMILCQINGIVEEGISLNAGKIRSIPVTISGTSYIPPLPFESIVKESIEDIINSNENPVKKAALLAAYVMKTQVFIDGNKRTAIIFANHYLIAHGLGLIVIPTGLLEEYRKLLIEYYESKSDKLIDFLVEECFTPLM